MAPKLVKKRKEVERSNAGNGQRRVVSGMTQNINDLRAVLDHINANQGNAEQSDEQFRIRNTMASKLNQRLEENLQL